MSALSVTVADFGIGSVPAVPAAIDPARARARSAAAPVRSPEPTEPTVTHALQ